MHPIKDAPAYTLQYGPVPVSAVLRYTHRRFAHTLRRSLQSIAGNDGDFFMVQQVLTKGLRCHACRLNAGKT